MRELMIVLVFAGLSASCCARKAEATEPVAEPAAPVENRVVAEEPPAPAVVLQVHYAGTGSPECDEYLRVFDDVIANCAEQLGPALDAMKQSRDAQREVFLSWSSADDEQRKANIEAAAIGCTSASDALRQSAASLDCPL